MPVEKLDAERVTDADEIAEVLAALRDLAGRSHSPLVRTCLESAAEDIAYLSGTGERPEE